MMHGIRIALVFLITVLSLATTPTLGAEPTEDIRTFARIFATLDAHDLKGYCTEMHAAPYTGYLSRACQSAVQNKIKKPEDCSQDKISEQIRIDTEQCLAMSADKFEETMLHGRVSRKEFVEKMAAQGIDGEKLLQDERAKIH